MCRVFACGGERRHAARSLLRNKAARANNANGLAFPSKVVYFQIRVHWRDSRVSLFSTRLGSTRRFEVEDFAKQIRAKRLHQRAVAFSEGDSAAMKPARAGRPFGYRSGLAVPPQSPAQACRAACR